MRSKTQSPKSELRQLKRALMCLAVSAGMRALMVLLVLPSRLISSFQLEWGSLDELLINLTRLVDWLSPIPAFFALWGLRRLGVFTAIRQRVAAVFIQATLVYFFLYQTPFSLATLEMMLRTNRSGRPTLYISNWLFENQWIYFGSGYVSQFWWVAWIVLLAPPSFFFACWSPKRERACRVIGLTIAIPFLSFALVSYSYRFNLFGIVDDPDALIRTALHLIRIAALWTIPLATCAAAIFLFHLYRHAHELLPPDPNHCTVCAYPLDQSMTTCPECGSTRTAQPAPQPTT